MPIYQIKAPDGNTYRIQGPEGATDEQVKAEVIRQNPSLGGAQESGKAAHYAGLTGRAITQAIPSAVLGFPALLADAYGSLQTLTRRGINAVAGTNYRDVQPFKYSGAVADVGHKAADVIGFPQPQTRMQEGLTNVATAGLSALGGAGLARAATNALPAASARTGQMARDVLSGLSSQPVLQATGAVGGATATDFARNAKLSPEATLGLGLVGSLAPGGMATAGQRAAGGVSGLVRPFTNPGREVIAGQVLNRLATNPTMAANRLAAAQEIVPGSRPTISQVSQDPGLIAAERGLVSTVDATGGQLAQRRSDQNAARQAALDRMILRTRSIEEGQTPDRGTLEYATAKRDLTVTQNRSQAFGAANEAMARQYGLSGEYGPTGFADLSPIKARIQDIKTTPGVGPRKDVQDAMRFVEQRLNQRGQSIENPENLYAVRKDISDAIAGKYDAPGQSNLKLAQGQLLEVRNSIDAAIEAAAPGYRRYMDLYSKRSIPLDQQKELQRLRAGGQDAISDPITGLRILSPAKFMRLFEQSAAQGRFADARLSENQLRTIQNIARDLDRAAASQSAIARTPGSDTMRNMSIASAIGAVIGKNFPDTPAGRATQTTLRPLSFLYSMPDEAIGQLLVYAALEPRLASQLMRRATKYEVESIANELATRAGFQAEGQAIYGQNQ